MDERQKNEAVIRAVMVTNDHCRSIMAACDQFLDWAQTMTKDELIARLRDEKQRFSERIRDVSASPYKPELY